MLVFRTASMDDLPGVLDLAKASPVGVTSLPADRDALYRKIQTSSDSIAADVSFHGEESYFFALEDHASGEILGVSALVASAGYNEPFYSYRNETLIHASPGLAIHHKIHALSLCHDLTGNTLCASYYIQPQYRFTRYSDLLSRARFLFIANAPHRFADQVVCEMVGQTDETGESPFWNAVGKHFFGLDYAAAEMHCGVRGRRFIAEMMPHHPIYVPLLPDAAQAAMGQIGEVSEVTYDVLIREGFEAERYIDIFDGGPTLQAATRTIRTFAQSRLVMAALAQKETTLPAMPLLVANTRLADYRAIVVDAVLADDKIRLPAEALQALAVSAGEMLRIAPL